MQFGKSKLKVKRNLQHPNFIFINNKRCELKSFHDSLSSIGFYSIKDIPIYRVLDDDIIKLSSFQGEDYWDMLTQVVFEHDELISIIEQKTGTIKKRAIQRSYNILTKSVEKEIPKKMELRNDIYNRVQLNRSFKTLYVLLLQHNQNILQAMIHRHRAEIQPEKLKLNEKLWDQSESKSRELLLKRYIQQNTSFLEAHREKVRELQHLINARIEDPASRHTAAIIKAFVDLKSIKKEEFLMPDYNKDDYVTYHIAAMKLCLAKAAKNGKFDYTKEVFNAISKHEERCLDILSSDDALATIVDNECTVDTDDLVNIEESCLENITEGLEKLLNLYKDSTEKFRQIIQLRINMDINDQEFKSLINVEEMIQSCPAHIKQAYWGPVFKYLKSSDNLDNKMWTEIERECKKIIFKTSETLCEFLDMFKPGELVGLDFVAVDNIQIHRQIADIHDGNNYKSMRDLVRTDINKSLSYAIMTLLHDYLLYEGGIWKPTLEMNNYHIKIFDNLGSFVALGGGFKLNNNFDKWLHSEDGPIDIINAYYVKLMEYLDIKRDISKLESEYENARKKFDNDKWNKLKNQIISICNKTTIEKDDKNPRLEADKLKLAKMAEILELTRADFEVLDEEKLRDEMNRTQAMESIHEYYIALDEKIAQHSVFLQKIRCSLAKILCKSFEAYDRDACKAEIQSSENFKLLSQKLEQYKQLMNAQMKEIEGFSNSIEAFLEDYTIDWDLLDDGSLKLFKKNCKGIIFESGINYLQDWIDDTIDFEFEFKKEIYDQFANKDIDVILKALHESYKKVIVTNEMKRIDLKNLDPTGYRNLKDSLDSVREFANKDVYIPMNVKKRAYPFMNLVIIKVIKDTVYNFTVAYNAVMVDFIEHSSLKFFTKSSSNEIGQSMSWDNFDLARLKAIDFSDKWKNDNNTLSASCRQLVKSLLMILHIVNYISIFKFVVISEKIFEVIS